MSSEQFHEEISTSELEHEEELETMRDRLESALNEPETRKKVEEDFLYTFRELGLEEDEAVKLNKKAIEKLLSGNRLDDTESEILRIFEGTRVKTGEGEEMSLVDVLHEKMTERAQIIHDQVAEYLAGIEGSVIDYGAGDGQVTQLLSDDGLNIEGCDVRTYKIPGLKIEIMEIDGGHVPVEDGHYEAGLMTNVAHHAKNNEQILEELSRIVSSRLVVIETVPAGETTEEVEKDRERTFLNDYLYNRLFHNANVPVPGNYETTQGWIERFEKKGWALEKSVDLGFDQKVIRDRHCLLVFKKK